MNMTHFINPFEGGSLFCRNSPSVGRSRASLVVQWLRIRLAMLGTQVQCLAGEDPTGCRATGPVCHNYWACTLEPWTQTTEARAPEPVLGHKKTLQREAQHTAARAAPSQEKPETKASAAKEKHTGKRIGNRGVRLPSAVSDLVLRPPPRPLLLPCYWYHKARTLWLYLNLTLAFHFKATSACKAFYKEHILNIRLSQIDWPNVNQKEGGMTKLLK